MTPMQSIQTVLANYANFSGRARRSEYWWFFLFVNVTLVVLNFVAALLTDVLIVFCGIWADFALALAGSDCPALHDTNRSGRWMLLVFVPVVGWIVMLVLFALSGTSGPNRHGPEPL